MREFRAKHFNQNTLCNIHRQDIYSAFDSVLGAKFGAVVLPAHVPLLDQSYCEEKYSTQTQLGDSFTQTELLSCSTFLN